MARIPGGCYTYTAFNNLNEWGPGKPVPGEWFVYAITGSGLIVATSGNGNGWTMSIVSLDIQPVGTGFSVLATVRACIPLNPGPDATTATNVDFGIFYNNQQRVFNVPIPWDGYATERMTAPGPSLNCNPIPGQGGSTLGTCTLNPVALGAGPTSDNR